jgi:poly-gamma-glutamate synthesis protein (capsule biosynthesis protein)
VSDIQRASPVLGVLALLLLNPLTEAQVPSPSNAPPVAAARDIRTETATKISESFTVAAVGDLYMPQPLYSSDARFQQLIDRIRKADVAFANMEGNLIDFRHFDGPVDRVLAPLEAGDSIKAMGISLVSHANNQTFNGGLEGMKSTDAALDKLGIVHAGTGRNLQEAREAQYLESPKGRIGLVAMFSMDDWSNYGPNFGYTAATYRNGNLGGAPGLNPLHLTAYRVVSREQLHTLGQLAGDIYGTASDAPSQSGGPERIRFFNEGYEAGPDVGAVHYDMNAGDRKDILESIRNGKVVADFLIATVHSHHTTTYKGLGFGGIDHKAPDFLIQLAHDSIDNGADMFVAHGVHALGGVEIYKGKPIFYGLSSFIFQPALQRGPSYDVVANEKAIARFEGPETLDALLTTSRFEGGRLVEVRLYPVDRGRAGRPISQMGIPLAASPMEAQRILRAVQEYSQPYGTIISIEDNAGVIRVGADGRSAAKK